MKIGIRLQLEPFGQIIERTLQRFLPEKYNRAFVARWFFRQGDGRAKVGSNSQIWLCNPDLNILFVPEVCNSTLEPIRLDMSYTPKRWQQPVRRLTIRCLTWTPITRRMARPALSVEPAIPGADALLWMGGSNKLYLLDSHTKCTAVVLKDGCDPTHIQCEIAARQRPGSWPIPPLLNMGEDGLWFEEPLIMSEPVAALRNTHERDALSSQALTVLAAWVEQTREERNPLEYAEIVAQKSRHYLMAGHHISFQECTQVEQWIQAALMAIQRLVTSGGNTLPVAHGHGDFQPGNIRSENGRLWIIDWEHAGQRQLVYDALVYALKSRYPTQRVDRVRAFVTDPRRYLESVLLADWLDFREASPARLRLMLAVFLLEELAWHLRENNSPQLIRPSLGWIALRRDIEPMLKAIE